MSNLLSNEIALTKYITKLSLMDFYYLFKYITTNYKPHLISTLVSPKYNKIIRIIIKASYFASLLEQQPLILNLYLVGIP